MTLFIQTRCPQCHNRFDMPEEQLDQIDVKGRCGQCQQVFLINDHLVVSADRQSVLLENEVSSNKGAFSQYGIRHLSGRDAYNFISVIYKIVSHTVISVNSEAIVEAVAAAKKLDKNADKRSNVIEVQPPINNDLQPKVTDSSNDSVFADSSADDFDAWQPSTKPTMDKNKTSPVSTSVPKPISIPSTTVVSASDDASFTGLKLSLSSDSVTHLLTNEKSVLDYKTALEQHYDHYLPDRTQSIAARSSVPAATIIWLAGCLVLLLLLLAQYIIFNLNTLIKNPTYAARLQAICSIVACGFPHADLSALSTADLSIRLSEINTNGDFSDLQAELLKNSVQAQLFSSIKVSKYQSIKVSKYQSIKVLVYSTDGMLGDFIAMPEDYLLSNQSQLAAEKSLRLMFTIPVAAQHINNVYSRAYLLIIDKI